MVAIITNKSNDIPEQRIVDIVKSLNCVIVGQRGHK